MQVEIISPEKTLFKGSAEVVTVPGAAGAFTILKNHAPIISLLKKGNIAYGTEASKQEIAIESGFLEAKNNKITICIEQ